MIAVDLQIEGDFRPPQVFVASSISRDFYPFSFDPIACDNPDTLAIAVTGFCIAGIRIGLLHRSVRVEDVHVKWERRSSIVDDPGSGDPLVAMRVAAGEVTMTTSARRWCDSEEKQSSKGQDCDASKD